jgi:tetratricopeptide (TPR) repeat protein
MARQACQDKGDFPQAKVRHAICIEIRQLVLVRKRAQVATILHLPGHNEGSAKLWKELGDCRFELGDSDGAAECYRKASAAAPGEPGPDMGLGAIALQKEDLAEALRCFQLAADKGPESSEAYCGLAMVHQQRGEFSQALSMYLRSLKYNCDNLMALLGLFQTSCKMGTFAVVIHFLEVYLDRHPDDASVLFCLATLYAREGKYHQAGLALNTVLAIDPGLAQARELLAQVQQAAAQKRTLSQVSV